MAGPAVARIAMHVFEQVQRGAAAAVEQLDVVGLDVQRRLAGQVPEQGVELGQPRGRQGGLGAQGACCSSALCSRNAASG